MSTDLVDFRVSSSFDELAAAQSVIRLADITVQVVDGEATEVRHIPYGLAFPVGVIVAQVKDAPSPALASENEQHRQAVTEMLPDPAMKVVALTIVAESGDHDPASLPVGVMTVDQFNEYTASLKSGIMSMEPTTAAVSVRDAVDAERLRIASTDDHVTAYLKSTEHKQGSLSGFQYFHTPKKQTWVYVAAFVAFVVFFGRGLLLPLFYGLWVGFANLISAIA